MRNIKNTYMYNQTLMHDLPVPWRRGDIAASKLGNMINILLNYIMVCPLKVNDSEHIKTLREKFYELYIGIHKELEQGTGVIYVPQTIFRDLNNQKRRELFFQLCQFIGNPVPINKQGELIREVKDLGSKDTINKPVRGHLTDQALAFHSDRADITALLCESLPESGGEFKICSSASLFLALKEYPEILKFLSNNVPHDLRDEGVGEEKFCCHPIISSNGSFVVRYIRKFVDSMARHGVNLDDGLVSALDHVDQILNNDSFYEEIIFSVGGLIIFNNHITLHARKEFKDSNERKRCLLRIWMSTEFSRELPESFKYIFHSTAAGSYRGGVIG